LKYFKTYVIKMIRNHRLSFTVFKKINIVNMYLHVVKY